MSCSGRFLSAGLASTMDDVSFEIRGRPFFGIPPLVPGIPA
jgi:hypothetical protein